MTRRIFRVLNLVRSPAVTPEQALPVAKPEPEFGRLLRHADTLRDAGDAAAAAAAYREVLALMPGRSDVRVQLGNMLKDSGQFDAAQAAYQQALAGSDQADTHLQLGHLFKARGNRDQALAEYRRAVELDPDTPGAVQELADAGDRFQQQRRFDAQLRGGGVEVLLTLSQAIASMHAELDRLSRLLPEAQARTAVPIASYDTFRALFPTPAPPERQAPAFDIVLLAEREEVATLFAQIGAIQAQSSPTWTLSILGHSPERRRVAELARLTDPRVRWVGVDADTSLASVEHHYAQAIMEDWILLLARGAMLDPQALAWFGTAAAWSGAAAFITDEEVGTLRHGHVIRSCPILRQVVDPDTLLDANVFGETIAVRSAAYRSKAHSVPHGSVAASRTALLLAVLSVDGVGHVPYPLAWAHAPHPAARLEPDGLADRPGPARPATPGRHPRQDATIAVIIPTRDNAADLVLFIRSLRETAAVPRALEIIIVDNGSTRAADLRLIQSMVEADGTRVLHREGPFNWSFLNNEAANQSQASLLLFANDDMRMLTPGWDTVLRELLDREDVGAVGARLLYGDDTVQHAGVLFGWKGSVIHDGLFEAADAPGPACRWQVTRAVGAVTGAFLATRRDRFLDLGGFDAGALPVAYSDIDFCLNLRAGGLKVLWTPAITLYHHESKTRGLDSADSWRAARHETERAAMEARWGSALDVEPGVHPFWHAATLPFRLLSSPSLERVRDHIVRTGSRLPWIVPKPEN